MKLRPLLHLAVDMLCDRLDKAAPEEGEQAPARRHRKRPEYRPASTTVSQEAKDRARRRLYG